MNKISLVVVWIVSLSATINSEVWLFDALKSIGIMGLIAFLVSFFAFFAPSFWYCFRLFKRMKTGEVQTIRKSEYLFFGSPLFITIAQIIIKMTQEDAILSHFAPLPYVPIVCTGMIMGIVIAQMASAISLRYLPGEP